MGRVVRIAFGIPMLLAATAHAAFERAPADARSGSLADAGVGWEAACPFPFGNPAQLARAVDLPASATRAGLYGIESLGWNAVWGGIRFSRGAVGAGVAQSGCEGYRETTLAVSLGFRQGRTGYGAALRVLNLGISGLSAVQGATLDLGVLERITDAFSLGLLAAGLGLEEAVSGPPRIQAGGCYQAGDGLALLVDVEQAAGRPRRIRLGIETRLASALALRIGRVSEPAEVCGGVGVVRGRLGVDLGVAWHAVLGFSERVTVRIGLGTEDQGFTTRE